MVIKEGYKQTEIGVIPNDWKIKYLEEISDVIDPHPSHRAPAEVSSGIPFLGIGDFTEDGELKKENYRVVSKAIFDEHKLRYNLNDELLGLGRVASIGKVVKFRNDIGEYTISPTLGILKPTNTTRDFLFQILKSESVIQYFSKIMSGSTRSSVGMIVLRKIPVPVPTKSEQTAIATALSDADGLITGLEKLIAKKRNIKQGAMQQLLQPKEGWEVKKLGEISQIYTGKKNNQDKVENGKYPFFVRSKTIETINSYSFDGEAILIPGEGNIGSIFHYINGKFDYHQRVYKISDFDDKYSGKYIYRYISEHFGKHAMQNSVKATVDSLRLPTFQVFEIPFPPSKDEQTRIASILSDMDAELSALEQKLEKYKKIKLGMMQELLTGKTRLV